jgi:hypothetical protein
MIPTTYEIPKGRNLSKLTKLLNDNEVEYREVKDVIEIEDLSYLDTKSSKEIKSLIRKLQENATGGNTNGMGSVVLANGDAEGSGDVPTSTKKMKKVRKFKDILGEMEDEDEEDNDELDIELTEEQLNLIIDILMNPETVNESRLEILDEGIFGSIVGGIGGLAFGKSIGKLLADTLGIKKKSPLYNVLTSRLVGTAIGAALGKKLNF